MPIFSNTNEFFFQKYQNASFYKSFDSNFDLEFQKLNHKNQFSISDLERIRHGRQRLHRGGRAEGDNCFTNWVIERIGL